MQINHIKRPWQRQHKQGNRYNPDPFYQSTTWKRTRAAFLLGESDLPDGRKISNQLCYECYLLGIAEPVHTVDHVDRIKAGGSKTDHNNMRSLCARHHAQKSARESNETRKQ